MSLFAKYIQAFGRFHRNAQLYLLYYVLSGVSAGILLVLYNLYLVSLGYKTDFIGLVLFCGTIGVGIAIFPAGICIDRFGGKIVLIVTTLLIGIIGAGQILFRQPFPLLVTSFIAGIVAAAFLVVNAPYLTANSTPEERSQLFSLNIVVQLVTTVLGEILGGALPQWFRAIPALMAPLPAHLQWLLAEQSTPRSYQLALLTAGLIAIPSLVPLFLMSDDGQQRAKKGVGQPVVERKEEQTQVLQARFMHLKKWYSSVRTLQLHALLANPFTALLGAWILVGLGAGLFVPYFNVFFVQHLGASSTLFGLIDGGANGINAVLTLLAPLLALRIGKINTVVYTRLISIPLLLLLGFTSVLPLAALLYLFRQGPMDRSGGIFQVYSMEAVPVQRRGVANSAYQSAIQVAWAATTPLGGLLIAHVGYSPVFVAGAVLYLMAIALLWLRFGRRSPKRHSEKSEEVHILA